MNPRTTFRELPDEEIRHLVDSLNSLQEGELGISMLVACGERAIPPLREFLIFGRPTSVPEPRQRAVRALAELGAKDVLLEYLQAPRPTEAVVRFAEEAVENTAARALAKWQGEDVFQVLLESASTRALTGVIETLGTFQRSEAVPHLIRALGDDVGRRAAADALLRLGEAARPALVDAARTPDPSRQFESPSSLLRRRAALRIVADGSLVPADWPKLQPLLWDPDPEMAAIAARIALGLGAAQDYGTAVQRMANALEGPGWLTAIEIEDCLLEHFQKVQRCIDAELERRTAALSAEEQRCDRVVRTLRRVKRRGRAASRGQSSE